MSFEAPGENVELRVVESFSEAVPLVLDLIKENGIKPILLVDIDNTMTSGLYGLLATLGPLAHLLDMSKVIPKEHRDLLHNLTVELGLENIAFISNREHSLLSQILWASSSLLESLPAEVKVFEGLNRQIPNSYWTSELTEWIQTLQDRDTIIVISDHNLIKKTDIKFIQHLIEETGMNLKGMQFLIK